MDLFKKYRQQSALNRVQEERLFAFVLEEIENSKIKPGLYAQALVATKGDDQKARAAYIKLRVQAIKDQFTIQQIVDEAYRAASKDETIDAAEVRNFSVVKLHAEHFEDFFYGLDLPKTYKFFAQVKCDRANCTLQMSMTYKTDFTTISHSKISGNVLIELEMDLWLSTITLDPQNKFKLRKTVKFGSYEIAESYIKQQVDAAIMEFDEFQKSRR